MDDLDLDTIERLRRTAVRDLRLAGDAIDPETLGDAVRRAAADERLLLTADEEDALVRRVLDEALGLGPLEAAMRDPEVTEIMVCGPSQVWLERGGRLQPSTLRFADDGHVLHVIDRILSPVGRRVDEASPMVDARLRDGSRVNVVIPPLAVDGPVITVRRFSTRRLDGDDLVARGALGDDVLAFLGTAVAARRNILVSGGTGSGKTTVLGALAAFVPPGERIITVEDAAELRVPAPHVVRLEARPAAADGRGEVTIRALVRNALRMRPDRIVVGEVPGGEALDMLTAMTTGHAGSLSTIHASSPAEAVGRLQLLASMADVDVPYAAIAEHVRAAIDLIVHLERDAEGTRRVTEVARLGDDGALGALTRMGGDGVLHMRPDAGSHPGRSR